LRNILDYFQQNGKDEKLKQVIYDAQALYKSDTINDSLAKKLLIIEDSLFNRAQLNHEMILFYAEVLARALKHLVPAEEHCDYANNLNNLASLYQDMGEYEKALPLYREAIAIRKKILGTEHPDYVISLNDLADLYHDMGEYKNALTLHQEALAIRKKVVGEEHPDYANSLNN